MSATTHLRSESLNRSRRNAAAGLCFLALLLATGTILGQVNAQPELSFGRVQRTAPAVQTVRLGNPTDSILEISDVETTPPLQAEILTPTILPGMQGSIRLELGADRDYGVYEGEAIIHFKNSSYPAFAIAVDAFVIPPIEFVPFPAFFVATNHGKTKSASIEIVNHRLEPLFLEPPQVSGDRYELNLETLLEGQHYRLTLRLDGKGKPGEQVDDIRLHTDPPLAEPLMVRAHTRIKERVYFFPPGSVDMGALPLNVATDENATKTLSQILMIYRPDTDDFEVEASLDLDYIDMTVERDPQGDRYQMDLTLIPEKVKPGKIDGTVTIKTNDKEFPILEVPVTGWILE
jgi:hypothetical protein